MNKKCSFCLTSIEPNTAFAVYDDTSNSYDDLREFTANDSRVYVCPVCQHQITQKALPLISSFNIIREG